MVHTITAAQAAGLRLSVIIPTRNRSRMLREALEALAVQTLDPSSFEVIVVDNCSSDDTPRMMPALAASLPFQVVYHVMPSNRGPARSRNTAAKMARGSILAFTDDDCRPDREWLERSLEAFDDPTVALVSGKVLFKPEQWGKAGFFARDGREVFEEHPTYTWSNSCYRKEVFDALGGSDERLCLADFRNRVVDCGDTDLAWRLKEAGHRNVFVPASLVYHELEPMRPVDWVCEPFRLFVVAELIRRHPDLRQALLYKGLFFNATHVLVYLGTLGAMLALTGRSWAALLAVPYFVWGTYHLRSVLSWTSIPKLLPQCLLLGARQAMCCAGMIYGSFKFRRVVL
jgi:glycosyltransferase involved in cell wall biosynthesis